ncbi:MAG: nucleotidyltransferase domain-containing protein [Lachnospiraceae bacterium]
MHTTIQKVKNLQLPSRFEQKLLRDIDHLLSANIPDLDCILLFGSCARGELRLTSDIDLLIITKHPLNRHFKGELSSLLEIELDGVKTDAIFYTQEQYEHSIRIFTTQIKKEGILLYPI